MKQAIKRQPVATLGGGGTLGTVLVGYLVAKGLIPVDLAPAALAVFPAVAGLLYHFVVAPIEAHEPLKSADLGSLVAEVLDALNGPAVPPPTAVAPVLTDPPPDGMNAGAVK